MAMESRYYADLTLWPWLGATLAAQVVVFIAWLWYWYHRIEMSLTLVLAFAVLFRVAGIMGFPILEDDIYRYLWDGFQWVEFGSPYANPPSAFFSADSLSDRFDDILGSINYPDIGTVYAPVNQWIFALAYHLAPGEFWPLQLAAAVADMLLIMMLLTFGPRHLAMLYAWSPLIIKEFAFTAHPDIFAVTLVAAALYWRRMPLVAAVFLGLAVSAKIFAVLAVPLLLRTRLYPWLLFLGVALASTWPFGPSALFNEGLSAMSGLWTFNAPLTQSLASLLPATHVLLITGTVFILLNLYIFISSQPADRPPLALVYGSFLLCAPVANPWYWVWVLPFAVLTRFSWPWIGAAVIPLAYISGINLQGDELRLYEQPVWALLLESAAILGAGCYDISSWHARRRAAAKNACSDNT